MTSRCSLAVLAGAVPLALVIVLGLAMTRGIGGEQLGSIDPRIGFAADFTLTTFDGEEFTLSDHADRPVFLYFWASWCAPCRQEAPLIQRLWPEYQARGYTFIGANIQDSESSARDFIDEFEITFPLVQATSSTIYIEYGVYGLPEAFFLAPGLTVSEKYVGPLEEAEFRATLDRLLPAEP